MPWWWMVVRVAIISAIVVAVAELSRRYPRAGALLLALPVVSILAFLVSWLQHPTCRQFPRWRARPSCLCRSRCHSFCRWHSPSAGDSTSGSRSYWGWRSPAPRSQCGCGSRPENSATAHRGQYMMTPTPTSAIRPPRMSARSGIRPSKILPHRSESTMKKPP